VEQETEIDQCKKSLTTTLQYLQSSTYMAGRGTSLMMGAFFKLSATVGSRLEMLIIRHYLYQSIFRESE